MHNKDYCDWSSLLADAGKFWIGFSKSDVLMAQQSEADLLCLLRRKFGLSDSEAMHQISDYLRAALSTGITMPAPDKSTASNRPQ